MSLRRFLAIHAARALAVLVTVNMLGYVLTTWVRAQRNLPNTIESVGPVSLSRSWASYALALPGGDWGVIPFAVPRPVRDVVLGALPRSLLLLGVTLLVASVAGVVLGLASIDSKRGTTKTSALMASLAGFSMPGFYLGIVMIEGMLQLSRVLGQPGQPLLPASGFGWRAHLVLPVIALAARPAAEVARLVAELVSEEMGREYMRMAAAKGRSRRSALVRHAFPNVAATAAVAMGGTLRYVISSLIVVELLFSWQGLGMRLAQALTPRTDGRPSEAMLLHPETVAALLTVFAALYLAAGLLTDFAARASDPRQRMPPRDLAARGGAA